MSLDVKTTDEIPAPKEGLTYTVESAEKFQSAVRGFQGLRVVLKDSHGLEVIETLWLREVVGPNSKLGAFIVVLGKNVDKWKGKKVRFVQWSQGKRKIELA